MLCCLLVPLGCKKKRADAVVEKDGKQRRETALVLEKCDVESSAAEKLDANGDGRADLVLVQAGGKEVCRAADLNFDGKTDRTSYFDKASKLRRVESDFDRDGLVDEVAFYEAGQLKEKHRATTLDGKLDTWDFFRDGVLAHTERDENGDGVIDQWWEYPKRGCPLIHVDADGDGRPDPGASIDYCKETGYVPPEVAQEKAEMTKDFGKKDARVEELSNVKEGETAPPAGEASSEAEPVPASGSEGTPDSTAAPEEAP